MGSNNNGFIKLHRGMLEWEWWDDIPVRLLWITILYEANWKDKQWHGMTIPRGSFWTSLSSLAQKSGLTVQQTKTALSKLQSTGEITSTATSKGRLVTVENYDFYQSDTRVATNTATNTATSYQQASNKHSNKLATTTEEIKNKEYKKGGVNAPSLAEVLEDVFEELGVVE